MEIVSVFISPKKIKKIGVKVPQKGAIIENFSFSDFEKNCKKFGGKSLFLEFKVLMRFRKPQSRPIIVENFRSVALRDPVEIAP